jgi:hypothetical protein
VAGEHYHRNGNDGSMRPTFSFPTPDSYGGDARHVDADHQGGKRIRHQCVAGVELAPPLWGPGTEVGNQ